MEEFYRLLSRKRVLGIINSLAKDKPLQFKEIKSGFDISDKTTFKITSELLEIGIVTKKVVVREGKHVDVYELTDLGKDIQSLLEQIYQRFKGKGIQLGYDEENIEDFDIIERITPTERRELTPQEREHIHIVIEKITKARNNTIRKKYANELFDFILQDLEQKTYWYSNKELFDFMYSAISKEYTYQIMSWVFQPLNRVFIDIRKDDKYRKKWFNKFFLPLQKLVEDTKLTKEIRQEAFKTIEEIRYEDGNLLLEVLEYFFKLHRENYKNKYYNSKEYGLFTLDRHISDKRTRKEQKIIEEWIEERLENPEKYNIDGDLKKEYEKVLDKIAKIER